MVNSNRFCSGGLRSDIDYGLECQTVYKISNRFKRGGLAQFKPPDLLVGGLCTPNSHWWFQTVYCILFRGKRFEINGLKNEAFQYEKNKR